MLHSNKEIIVSKHVKKLIKKQIKIKKIVKNWVQLTWKYKLTAQGLFKEKN